MNRRFLVLLILIAGHIQGQGNSPGRITLYSDSAHFAAGEGIGYEEGPIAISSCANVTGALQCTVPTTSGMSTGKPFNLAGITGAGVTQGIYPVTVVNPTVFSVNGVSASGTYYVSTATATLADGSAMRQALAAVPAGANVIVKIPSGYAAMPTSEILINTGAASLKIRGDNGAQLIQGADGINLLHVMQSNVEITGIRYSGNSHTGGVGVLVGQSYATYTTGTASVAFNGTTVTGVGTSWTSAMVGGLFSDFSFYNCVITAASATSLTCAAPGYTGPSGLSGAAYAIVYINGGTVFSNVHIHNNSYSGMGYDTFAWNTDQLEIDHETGTNNLADCMWTNVLLGAFTSGATLKFHDNWCYNPHGVAMLEEAGNGIRALEFEHNHLITTVTPCSGLISGGSSHYGGPFDQLIGKTIAHNYGTCSSAPVGYNAGAYFIETYGHNMYIADNHSIGPWNTGALYDGYENVFAFNDFNGIGVTSPMGATGFAFDPNNGGQANPTYSNTWISNKITNAEQGGIIGSPGGGDLITGTIDNRAPGFWASDSTQIYQSIVAGGVLPSTLIANAANLLPPVNGFSLSMPGSFLWACITNQNTAFATGPLTYQNEHCNNQNATRFGQLFFGSSPTYFNGASLFGSISTNLQYIGGGVTGLLSGASTIAYGNNQSLAGLGTPPAVTDFLIAESPQPSATVVFTPTAVGWYRILTGVDGVSGQVEVFNTLTDNRSTDVVLDFAIDGFTASPGQINGTRFQNYTGGIVDQATISNDGAGSNYLDIHIASATSPTPVTLYFNGFAIHGFGAGGPVAAPVVGATAAVNAKTVTVAPGFFSTEPLLPNIITPGSCGDLTHSCTVTYDAEGLIISAVPVGIAATTVGGTPCYPNVTCTPHVTIGGTTVAIDGAGLSTASVLGSGTTASVTVPTVTTGSSLVAQTCTVLPCTVTFTIPTVSVSSSSTAVTITPAPVTVVVP